MTIRQPIPSDGNTRFTLGGDRTGSFRDTIDNPDFFDGTTGLRIVAYLIDVVVLLALQAAAYVLVFMTFGLLAVFLPFMVLLPFAYHILTVSSPAQATLGQRIMGLKVVTAWGDRMPLLQAGISTILFYATLSFTGGLLLAWALFDDKNRCLHDILSGAVVIKADSGKST